MKKITRLALASILSCCSILFVSCNNGPKQETQQETTQKVETVTEVQSTELLRTSISWNDAELPDYPQGKPEIVAVKYTVPPGAKLGWHHHVSMNHGILVQGELTIIGKDGKTTTIKEGEPVVEMVDAVHRGENRGDKTVILYMFYLSQKDLPLSVPFKE